jgi:sigma-B regulation protein RsbU (phosphoserine phosphatase)
MSTLRTLNAQTVLDSINEGVYVTDVSRKIVYWGKAAERITGWPADEVVGKRCHEEVLCHIDKDGHQLCGEEHCPLHRSMVTGQSSTVPIIVFAQKRDGGRVPLQVSVGPLRDEAGELIGGVESFRDLSREFADISRARKIQMLSLQHEPPADPRIHFTVHYVPHDVIGGDYFAVEPLGPDRYGFLLADVTGHGVPAALYTMFLSSLWDSHKDMLTRPAEFARAIGDQLHHLIQEDEPFAAALCGLFDVHRRELRLVGAGNPPPLLFRSGGGCEEPAAHGLPLGLMPGTEYDETVVPLARGDRALFFTDGATEIAGLKGGYLGTAGLRRVLADVGYPAAGPVFGEIESRLLAASNRIRFDDDLTFVEVQVQ